MIPSCRWYGPNLKDPKDSTKKHLEVINPFDKIVGYEINTWKLVTFLITNRLRKNSRKQSQSW
jgi:hypothetical protein